MADVKDRWSGVLKLLALAGLVVAGVLLVRFTPVGSLLSREGIVRGVAYLRAFPVAPLIFVPVHARAVALAIPGTIPTLAGGAVFGLWWGTVFNWLGATIGANLGNLYRLRGRYRQAKREYLRSLGPNPRHSRYTNGLNELARLYMGMAAHYGGRARGAGDSRRDRAEPLVNSSASRDPSCDLPGDVPGSHLLFRAYWRTWTRRREGGATVFSGVPAALPPSGPEPDVPTQSDL